MEITEGKLKEILTEQRQDFQHFMGVMKEETNAQFQVMGEQFQGIHTTLNSHAQMLGAIMEDLSIIKSDVQFLKVAL